VLLQKIAQQLLCVRLVFCPAPYRAAFAGLVRIIKAGEPSLLLVDLLIINDLCTALLKLADELFQE
jgi:hypothetical protein